MKQTDSDLGRIQFCGPFMPKLHGGLKMVNQK